MIYSAWMLRVPLKGLWIALLCIIFATQMIVPPPAHAIDSTLSMQYTDPISSSTSISPPLMRGMTIDPNDPFVFDFIIDNGQNSYDEVMFKSDAYKLIKYFMACLTIPEKEQWVNLSPYEKDRIIPDSLGQTQMGRDLLIQDYFLKKMVSSIISPESEVGRTFWNKVYQVAQERYGTVDIPLQALNKVWIVPDEAVVYESGQSVFVSDRSLQMMLDEDVLARDTHLRESVASEEAEEIRQRPLQDVSTQVLRDVVLPQLNHELNHGPTFKYLRQMYDTMILASWYKLKLKNSLLGQVYVNRNQTSGIEIKDPVREKEEVYQQYIEAFRQGAYDVIKEDYDPVQQQILTRKFFSGGWEPVTPMGQILPQNLTVTNTPPDWLKEPAKKILQVTAQLSKNQDKGFFRLPTKNALISFSLIALTCANAGCVYNPSQTTNTPNGSQSEQQLVQNQQDNQKSNKKSNQNQQQLATTHIQWLLDNTFDDDYNDGGRMPRLHKIPDDANAFWNALRQGQDEKSAIIESAIIKYGSSLYDSSVWQIALAATGDSNIYSQADIVTNILNQGRWGELNTIRAYKEPFKYKGQTISAENALFFRIISNTWRTGDPLTGKARQSGFNVYNYEPDLIVWADWAPILGENAWGAGIGPLQLAYTKYSGSIPNDSEEMKLVLSIETAIQALTTDIGAVHHAPAGTWGKDPDDISTENNLSLYVRYKFLYQITKEDRFKKAYEGIENYLKNYAFDKTNGIFLQGGFYNGQSFKKTATFAVDVQTWGILKLKPQLIDEWFGEGAAFRMWQVTKERAGYYENDALLGVGYSDENSRGEGFHSAEWTAGAIAANLELYKFYKNSHPDWAAEALNDALSMFAGVETRLKTENGGYLYANKRYRIPFGWFANPIENTASTAWMALLKMGFDPSVLGGQSGWLDITEFKAIVEKHSDPTVSLNIPQNDQSQTQNKPQTQTPESSNNNVQPQNNNSDDTLTDDDRKAMEYIVQLKITDPTAAKNSAPFNEIKQMGKKAVPALIMNLQDSSAQGDTRKWSAYLLGVVGDSNIVRPILEEVINSSDYEWFIQQEAQNGLDILNQRSSANGQDIVVGSNSSESLVGGSGDDEILQLIKQNKSPKKSPLNPDRVEQYKNETYNNLAYIYNTTSQKIPIKKGDQIQIILTLKQSTGVGALVWTKDNMHQQGDEWVAKKLLGQTGGANNIFTNLPVGQRVTITYTVNDDGGDMAILALQLGKSAYNVAIPGGLDVTGNTNLANSIEVHQVNLIRNTKSNSKTINSFDSSTSLDSNQAPFDQLLIPVKQPSNLITDIGDGNKDDNKLIGGSGDDALLNVTKQNTTTQIVKIIPGTTGNVMQYKNTQYDNLSYIYEILDKKIPIKKGDQIQVTLTLKQSTALGVLVWTEARKSQQNDEWIAKKIMGDTGGKSNIMTNLPVGKKVTVTFTMTDDDGIMSTLALQLGKDAYGVAINGGLIVTDETNLENSITVHQVSLVQNIKNNSKTLDRSYQEAMGFVQQLTMEDPNEAKNSSAYKNIVKMGQKAAKALEDNLKNPQANPDTRKWSAFLLAIVGDPTKVRPTLEDVIGNPDYEWFIQEEAQNGLNLLNNQSLLVNPIIGLNNKDFLKPLDQKTDNDEKVGGIKWDTKQLDLKIKGTGQDFVLPTIPQTPYMNFKINSLTPQIIQIQLINLPVYLGFNDPDEAPSQPLADQSPIEPAQYGKQLDMVIRFSKVADDLMDNCVSEKVDCV